MRIVIDLQPCQNGSRRRGIGRYSMAITRAMIKLGRSHEFIVALNQSFPETIDDVRKELGDLLPQDAFAIFSVPRPATSADPANAWRNRAAEMVRSHFLENLAPDLVFIPSLHEGFWDDTVVSVEREAPYLTAVTLYDLIPLEDPDGHLGSQDDRNAYLRRLNQLRRADLILPISNYVAQAATGRLQLRPDKVIVAHCGVESHFIPPGQSMEPRAALLADYGITRPYVMTASPFEPRKNIEGLIAGFASMSAEIRDGHQLVLLGKMDTFARNYLNDLAISEGLLKGALVCTGFVPDSDLPALYHRSSVFAFPSFSEGFGLPLLEAMACAAPVVGSDRTSIPEVVGRADLLCDPYDAMGIGRTIERILSNPDLQRELRSYGPRRAAQFTWEKTATTLLDAFELLYGRSVKTVVPAHEPVQEVPDRKLRTMAYVLPDVSCEHRLAGVNNALIASLADLFDLTIIETGSHSLGSWILANCQVQSVAWFESNAEKFEHILYCTDITAGIIIRRLMSGHGGSALLVERLSPPGSVHLVGRQIFDGAQLALVESGGIGALSAAVEAELREDDVMELLQQDLTRRVGQFFFEVDARCASSGRRLDILPAVFSEEARRAFRARADVAETTELIVAILADEQAAAEIIRIFRGDSVRTGGDRTLLVFHESTQPDGTHVIRRLFGDVLKIYGDLDTVYCGLLSGADMLILDRNLPERTKIRLEADGKMPHIISCIATECYNSMATLLGAAPKIPFNRAAHDVDVTGTARARSTAVFLKSLISKSEPDAAERRLQALVRRMPGEVRGTRPDGNDLAQVAISLVQNEVCGKLANLYIDVTAFAGPGPRRRVDLAARNWLKALFRQGGAHVQAVYANNDHFVAANQFAARICGIADAHLKDQVVIAAPGDRILGLDLCDAFPDSSFAALQVGQRRGMSASYVVLGSAALDREEFLPPLADLLLLWCSETQMRTHLSISALPRARRKRSAGWKLHRHHERIAALEEAGLYANILLCDDDAGKEGKGEAAIAELSAPVLEAYRKWEAFCREPAIPVSHGPSRASDFGHVITGHLIGSYSLAIINRMMARALEGSYPGQVRYLPVETVSINHTEGVPVDEKQLMIELSSRPPLRAKGEIVISHHYPIIIPEGQYSFSLAMFFWEESRVPSATIEVLSKGFDAVISPTSSVTKALIDSGLAIPVATIGQPVNIDHFAALATASKPRRKVVTFLHVSSSFRRKGIDVLLSAWAQAFTSADNVRLIIKTFPNPHNDVEEQVAALRARRPNLAEIVIVNRDVEAEDMPQYYAEADVMVLPTRGEGYNLPALEAMAAGLPLIVTGYGGHSDFCGEQEARLIRYSFAKSQSHVSDHHSLWVEPDVGDLIEAMREQIEPAQLSTIESRRQRAMLAALRESDEAAWLHRYDVMISELQKSAHQKPARIAWISTWGVQCGIAQYSSYLLNHFSLTVRNEVFVICDSRTEPDPQAEIAYKPAWEVQNVPKVEEMLRSVEECGAEAVVLQHQDGLLSWEQLGLFANDQRLVDKATIVILHNAGNMVRAEHDERVMLLNGLRKMSRVLVHTVADVNFLTSLGLKHNVGLLPHGAFARDRAPWPRRLSATDEPVIGCHGFFFPHKGIDKLIRAAALLRREWPHLKLRLVNAQFPGEGHDVHIQECKQLANSLGMADAIEWYQDFLSIDEIDLLLASCDIIALPYDESDDSASGAVRVSLSSMVPLVATRVKIFEELGEAAEWADSNDPQVLADTLASLLRKPEKRRTVQAAMHEWLVAHDWKSVAGTLEGMIQGLVKQKRLGWDYERALSPWDT